MDFCVQIKCCNHHVLAEYCFNVIWIPGSRLIMGWEGSHCVTTPIHWET
ncbi:MAG: hypothetical protein QGG23_00315 [Candidatus Bathyarchaeota archaeon]|nr:hypothetical protein [Candidatus Bathyarchaeota archaeon]MDP7208009.1 hypothetical protein [Candidatus Bathyarchaeota archaeon]